MPFCRIGKKEHCHFITYPDILFVFKFLGEGDGSACAPFPRDRFSKKKKKRGEEDLVARAQPHKERSQTKDQKFNFDDIF